MDAGLAGLVATTGEAVVVGDCRQDPRFHSGVDSETGYTTVSMVALPITIRGSVIGVLEVPTLPSSSPLQFLNKRGGGAEFTPEDVELFKVFASYIGLALHHAKLYDKIRRSDMKTKVVQEVVNYQSAAPQHEVEKVRSPGARVTLSSS